MPGFNQQGPMNEGPMTGRRMGRCAMPSQDAGGPVDAAWNAPGFGRGRGMALGGRGRCRRTWWNQSSAVDAQPPRQASTTREETLTRKVQELENQLAALKSELRSLDE